MHPQYRPLVTDNACQCRRRPSEKCLGFALLANLRLLAAQGAQVVELRATNITAGDNLDVINHGRVQGERALDTDLEADLANGEGCLLYTSPSPRDS